MLIFGSRWLIFGKTPRGTAFDLYAARTLPRFKSSIRLEWRVWQRQTTFDLYFVYKHEKDKGLEYGIKQKFHE